MEEERTLGPRRRVAAFLLAAALGAAGLGAAILMPGRAANATVAETLPSTNPTAVPRPTFCQPTDKPEAAAPLQLQGQVPWADRLSGRAAQGYNCNLAVVSNFGNRASDPNDPFTSFANFDTYKDCAYHTIGDDSFGSGTGTAVLDVSDQANPVQTEYLTSAAAVGGWESVRVNAKRRLLVIDNNGSSALDIYDVGQDCRHPRLLFSGNMPTAIGHEGWFSPDGNTWWMSRLGKVVPIDISDPAHPVERWAEPAAGWPTAHGGSSSDDGTRQYFCHNGSPDQLLTLDSSDFQFRVPNAELRTVSAFDIPDNSVCQQTYPLLYGNHPYVTLFGESAPGSALGAVCPYNPYTNFSHPRIIDMADEQHPVVASEILKEVDLPSNCALIDGDRNSASPNPFLNVFFAVFRYDTHQCSPDRLHDPTILACADFMAGVRVYDIRDPYNVREIAYFNVGTNSSTDPTVGWSASRPVVRATKGQIWVPTLQNGFYVLRFEGVYPWQASLRCSPTYDYYFKQYNPETMCAGPTAVAVERLTARRQGKAIRVSWTSAAEADIAGYNVYRKAGHQPFKKLNRTLIPARHAGSATGASYRLVDRAVQRSQRYVYRLQVVNQAGNRSWYDGGATVS
jgi:hypothetical protein